MKYLVLLCDGLSDRPIKELNNKTIMQAANIPNLDKLAAGGMCGLIHTVPQGMSPGSDVCNLSVFGYDPKKYYTGRSPIEAASIGVTLNENDTALRCNIVKLGDNNTLMEDFTAGHINAVHSGNVINRLQEIFNDRKNIEFYKGVSYRNIVVLRDMILQVEATPPHDITGKKIPPYMPKGKDGDILNEIMDTAKKAFDGSIDSGNSNAIWLWGEGTKLALPSFKELYGLNGAVISAVDLVNGIGVSAGMDIVKVPNVTGFLDTNFEGKAEYAIKTLENHDYIFVHVEATDECGHMGDIQKKIEAIEAIDSRMVPIILDGLNKFGDYRILVTPDHPTPIEIKTHSSDPVPAILYGKGIKADENTEYNEYVKPSFDIKDGYRIADFFIKHS